VISQNSPLDSAGIVPASKLIALFSALDQISVRYCSWKGNYRLMYVMAGIDDVDLHVHPQDFELLQAQLLTLHFKLADTPSNRLQAGVFHFLGNDLATGKLLNVHVYTRILTGDHMLKTWLLPMSDLLLSNTEQSQGIRTTTRTAELAIHVVRCMLKYTTLYDLYRAESQAGERSAELAWILEEADVDAAFNLLHANLPAISRERYDVALELLTNDQASLGAKIFEGLTWAWLLRKHRRFGLLKQALFTGSSMSVMAWNRLLLNQKHMRLLNGGQVIALIGPQATGKSTLAKAVKAWLGEELSIQVIHTGKPPRRLLTWFPSLFIPLAKKFKPAETTIAIEASSTASGDKSYPWSYVLRKLMLAYERVSLLRRAFRRASAGAIVLTDRYPSDTVGAIDSASFDQVAIENESSALKRWLMQIERNLYQQINSPNLVIKLEVDVDEAIRRNITRDKIDKQSNAYVAARHAQPIRPLFHRCPTVVLQTDKPLDESILEIKELIWRHI
jgi:thymidylate kinase